MEQIWQFLKTLGRGIIQGFNQFIDNDLQSYLPLFILAAVLLVAKYLYGFIRKIIK